MSLTTSMKVTLYWKAFESETHPVASLSFTLDEPSNHLKVLSQVFQETNLYRGPIWKEIEKRLPDGRSHTALSVGDEIEIQQVFADGQGIWLLTHLYRCECSGWSVQSTDLRPLVQIKDGEMLKSLVESN